MAKKQTSSSSKKTKATSEAKKSEMTEDTSNQNAAASADETSQETKAGAQNVPRQLVMHAQYVKDMSFENPNAAQTLAKQSGPPEVEVGVNVTAEQLNAEQYEVSLILNANAKSEDQQLFIVELTYAGVVSVQGARPDEVNPMVMIEGPRLLFPFARAQIANLTREGGYLPLNIQPIDFVAVYRANLQAQQQKAQQQAQAEADQNVKQ